MSGADARGSGDGGAVASRRSAVARLRLTRVALAVAATVAALLWALAAALATVLVLVVIDRALGLSQPLRGAAIPFAAVVGAALCLLVAWRNRGVMRLLDVALWIEHRAGSMSYALVTLADPGAGERAELEVAVAGSRWTRPLAIASARAVAVPLAASLALVMLLRALPAPTVLRLAVPRPGDVLAGPAAGRRDRLAPLVATVSPPPYTRLPSVTLEDPATIPGVEGSAVVVEGRGDPAGLRARVGDSALAITRDGDRWRSALLLPPQAAALRFTDGGESRVIVLAPFADSVPVVTITSPARDSVLRSPPRGALRLEANLHDDFGLTSSRFEVIVTSGELETFTSRTAVVGAAALSGVRDTTRDAVLPLDSLGLQPGDVLSVRAVAADGRVPVPDRGASETRTWRIARVGEYDSLAIEGAPPPGGDSSLVSERMLIMTTEALQRRRPHLARAQVVGESRDISRDQARLRRRVADIVFMRLSAQPTGEESEGEQGAAPQTPAQVLAAAEAATARATGGVATDFSEDESPVVAVNRPLLEAYDAMWDATRELDIGEPGTALPFMRAALAAIQRAREAERVYLRGAPPRVVVDLPRVRLAGDRAGAAPSGRVPRTAEPRLPPMLAGRFARDLAMLLAGAPGAAADSLQLLRVDALDGSSEFAAALDTLVRRLRAGGDATAALIAARRAADAGTDRAAPGLARWAGVAP